MYRERGASGDGLQWARDRSNSIHATNDTHVRWSLPQRHSVCDNQDCAAEDTRRSHTGNCTADDESSGVGRNAADEGADLEDEEGGEVDPFDRVEGVEFAVDELCRAGRKEVGTAVPPDVVQGFKLICDAGNGGRDNCVVLKCRLACCARRPV